MQLFSMLGNNEKPGADAMSQAQTQNSAFDLSKVLGGQQGPLGGAAWQPPSAKSMDPNAKGLDLNQLFEWMR